MALPERPEAFEAGEPLPASGTREPKEPRETPEKVLLWLKSEPTLPKPLRMLKSEPVLPNAALLETEERVRLARG